MVSTCEFFDWKWEHVREFLPFDLDGLAVETGALLRRRAVVGGEALVRTLLLTACPKTSLSQVCLLAREAGLADMTKPALFKRLANAEELLRKLFESTLRYSVDTGERWNGLNLVAVDATCLCGPRASGTDFRLHTVYDLGKGAPRSVDLTDVHGGEKLARHTSFGKGDLVISDAGYGPRWFPLVRSAKRQLYSIRPTS